MKALLIDPTTQTIEPIDITDHDDVINIIGYDTIASDEIGPEGDRLFFDEECFLRGTEGRFQIDSVVPVSGKGLIIGSPDDGATLQDVRSDSSALQARLKYL